MDTNKFSNDHFRKMVKNLQATPQSFMESKYEKPVREAVPFKKNALNEVDPSKLEVGKEYIFIGILPGTDEVGEIKMTYKGIVPVDGTKYHSFGNDETKTSGIFVDRDIETRFKSPEEKGTEDYESFLRRFKGE